MKEQGLFHDAATRRGGYSATRWSSTSAPSSRASPARAGRRTACCLSRRKRVVRRRAALASAGRAPNALARTAAITDAVGEERRRRAEGSSATLAVRATLDRAPTR